MVKEYMQDETDEEAFILQLDLMRSQEPISIESNSLNQVKAPLSNITNSDSLDEQTEWCVEY